MNDKTRFTDILKNFSTAMLTTMNEHAELQSRPMQVADVSGESTLIFVTDKNSTKVDQIEAHPQVCVTMQGGAKYLSLTGSVKISQDHDRLGQLWNKAWDLWFPKGIDDPNILMLLIEPRYGEFWDMSGTNRYRFIIEAGKALLQGEGIDSERVGENAKVDFQST